VAQAAVVGVQDERWGESGAAFVVVRAGMATDEQELLEHCAAQLSGFKVPTTISMVGALPRTALNKVLRARLRQELARPEPAPPGSTEPGQPLYAHGGRP
jgi:fatty-acyl-CoA synthase